ncbi:uncharacterized protein LOC144065946 [Stigmatopora argus]
MQAKVILHRLEGFRENLSPDVQEFVGLKELPQIKEEEPEFPQQQMREEQLPIKKEKDDVTWSTCEALTRQDDLEVASEGAVPENTLTWPQIKGEEPEFQQQQHKREEQSPIKKEEQNVTGSTGEPFKSEDDLGVANRGAEPLNRSSREGWQAESSIEDGDDLPYDDDDDDNEDVKKIPMARNSADALSVGIPLGKGLI